MLTAARVLSRVQAHGITLLPDGNHLRLHPASALTPEMVEELRQHKEDILSILRHREEVQQDTSPRIEKARDVFKIAREVLPKLEEEDRVDLDELIQANSPPPPGRDPLVRRGSDKQQFFRGDWRQAWPRDFKVYEGGES
jgi:hypothetical protein